MFISIEMLRHFGIVRPIGWLHARLGFRNMSAQHERENISTNRYMNEKVYAENTHFKAQWTGWTGED